MFQISDGAGQVLCTENAELAAPHRPARNAAPLSVSNQPSTRQFTITVTQNTLWNVALLDLCRKTLWANSAPGQPPMSPNRCSVLSAVLQRPKRAADLSNAYAPKATALAQT